MSDMNNSAERTEVSLHEVKIYLVLKHRPDEWLTGEEISEKSGVNPRTCRMHTVRLMKLGVIEQVRLHPAHRYRFPVKSAKRNESYIKRVEQAAEIFGLKMFEAVG
jgi:predicted ArsR family transcriptional regulator